MNENSNVQELMALANKTRVFLSMPYIHKLSPTCLDNAQVAQNSLDNDRVERRHGCFPLHQAALSPLDHGNLYGDAAFEGIKISNRRLILLKEHVDRWFQSADQLLIPFPYSKNEIIKIIIQLTQSTLKNEQNAYLRPVLTRGIGNLGLNPKKCLAPTLYIICSTISLYPQELYDTGIDLAIARKIRRNNKNNLDPNIKCNNYLNNILALLETRHLNTNETLMLTNQGCIAEATADNIFVAHPSPNGPTLHYPTAKYALIGLTRNWVIQAAQSLDFITIEDEFMLPTDLVGPHREPFMTGTACGIMPIRNIDGINTIPQIERKIIPTLQTFIAKQEIDTNFSLSIDATNHEIAQYLSSPPAVPINITPTK